MSDHTVTDLHRPIRFTIDGRPYETRKRKQPAADLLRLAGLDPTLYDLGVLRGHQPQPMRFADDDIVTIHEAERFVSIRQSADVA
jgi:hypothetical protein